MKRNLKFITAALALAAISACSNASSNNTKNFENNKGKMERPLQNQLSKEDFLEKLGLSDEQTTTMNSLLTEYKKKAEGLFQNSKHDMNVERSFESMNIKKGNGIPQSPEIQALIEKLNEKTKAILDNNQYEIYEQYITAYLRPTPPIDGPNGDLGQGGPGRF